MRILIIDNGDSGCFLYRGQIPLAALEARGHTINLLIPGTQVKIAINDYDVIMVLRAYAGNVQDLVIAAENNGVGLVYDTDDALDRLSYDNIVRGIVRQRLPSYYYLMNRAQQVTCTTPILAGVLRQSTPRPITAIPNAVNLADWPMRPKKGDKLRIGFSGSNTHVLDVQIALKALIELQKEVDFEFILSGFFSGENRTYWDWMAKNDAVYKSELESGRPISKNLQHLVDRIHETGDLLKQIKNVSYFPAVGIDNYPAHLASWDFDIGIAPLIDSAFNECKSTIKIIEYAVTGTVAVASNVAPYKGDFAMPVENTVEDWVRVLRSLATDPALRESTLEKQRAYAAENYNIEKYAELWESVFAKAIEEAKANKE